MDELVARSADGEIECALSWPSRQPTSTAAEATLGELRVCLRGRPVWYGVDDTAGAEWTWIELLEFLGENWLYLSVEDGSPLGVAPTTAPRMLAAAEAAADRLPPAEAEFEREQIEAYRSTHDLAEALQGAVAPPLWVLRDGNVGWMASSATAAQTSFSELLRVLAKIGDSVAQRLDGSSDPRSIQAVTTWHERDCHDRLRIIEASTGYPPELVAEVESVFASLDELDGEQAVSNELLAAARLVGPQPLTTLRPIIRAIRSVKSFPTPELDDLVEPATAIVRSAADEPPYAQGHELAAWLRTQPGIAGTTGRVNPDDLLKSWGVPVVEVGLGMLNVDAIGCWGPNHGPAVLLNTDRRHAGNSGRRRATLAHEICHLLVDRATSLPLVEVLGGRTAEHVEQRAGAFAAELLLPRDLAGKGFLSFGGDDERAAKSLRARYGVSSALLGWQVRNAQVPLSRASQHFVDRLVGE